MPVQYSTVLWMVPPSSISNRAYHFFFFRVGSSPVLRWAGLPALRARRFSSRGPRLPEDWLSQSVTQTLTLTPFMPPPTPIELIPTPTPAPASTPTPARPTQTARLTQTTRLTRPKKVPELTPLTHLATWSSPKLPPQLPGSSENLRAVVHSSHPDLGRLEATIWRRPTVSLGEVKKNDSVRTSSFDRRQEVVGDRTIKNSANLRNAKDNGAHL